MLLKIIFITIGSLALALGALGIIIPGLPTTPFILLSATLYLRSSDKLYKWISTHKIFGKIILNFKDGKSWTIKTKILSILIMLVMISSSVIFFIQSFTVKLIVIISGFIGFITMLLLPVYKKK